MQISTLWVEGVAGRLQSNVLLDSFAYVGAELKIVDVSREKPTLTCKFCLSM